MSCCDPINESWEEANAVGECPDCGSPIDEDGDCLSKDSCGYSPEECATCGWRPCNLSC